MKQETLKSWNAYVRAADARLKSGQSPFFQVNGGSEDLQLLRRGEILVSSAGHKNPRPIPAGLIHDWMGTAFIPDTTIDDVFSAVRDYDRYKDFYKPAVVDSKLLASDRGCDTYSLRVVNKENLVHTALDMENETCYFRVDQQRWYSVTHTIRVQEIRHYGTASQEELPPDQGSGYIWRLYSLARFEQKDGGVYVEVEAIALSRSVPVAIRWVVNPIVRRVSRNSMFLSLRETGEAVHSTMAAGREGGLPASTRDLSPAGTDSKAVVANSHSVPRPGR